jgi:kinesin family member 5
MLKRAKLNLCDLAGSEKINKDEEMEAKHLLELKTINLSLTTLGKCISSLSKKSRGGLVPIHSVQSFSKKSKKEHIPYRESKLTRLLQDSLGGNTKTCLIATISPISD